MKDWEKEKSEKDQSTPGGHTWLEILGAARIKRNSGAGQQPYFTS